MRAVDCPYTFRARSRFLLSFSSPKSDRTSQPTRTRQHFRCGCLWGRTLSLQEASRRARRVSEPVNRHEERKIVCRKPLLGFGRKLGSRSFCPVRRRRGSETDHGPRDRSTSRFWIRDHGDRRRRSGCDRRSRWVAVAGSFHPREHRGGPTASAWSSILASGPRPTPTKTA